MAAFWAAGGGGAEVVAARSAVAGGGVCTVAGEGVFQGECSGGEEEGPIGDDEASEAVGALGAVIFVTTGGETAGGEAVISRPDHGGALRRGAADDGKVEQPLG